MARPSVHDPMTKSYAIDQIEDIEHLRKVAHRMWEAFYAANAQAAHIIGALVHDDCEQCQGAMTETDDMPCPRYRTWQRKINDGYGSV